MSNNVYDLGYNRVLTKDPIFEDVPAVKNLFSAGIVPSNVLSGELTGNLVMADGYMRSANYVASTSGWKIDKNGNVEFDSGYFRGSITGATGIFSGSLAVGADAWHVDTNGNMWWGSAASYADATIKISSAGVANLSGLVVGTNVDIGTAQTAAQVTTIVGNTITTGYVNALGITVLGAVTAGSLTGLTVTGGTFQTAASGMRVVLSSGISDNVAFYNSDIMKGTLLLNSSNQMWLENFVGSIRLSVKTDGNTRDYLFNSENFYPVTNNYATCGGGANAWSNVISYAFTDLCLWLDEEDDLKILKACQPMKDKKGNYVLDEKAQKPKMDNRTLPSWLNGEKSLRDELKKKVKTLKDDISKIKSEIKKTDISDGQKEILKERKEKLEEEFIEADWSEEKILSSVPRNLGHFVDVIAGAVRQLDTRLEALEKKIT